MSENENPIPARDSVTGEEVAWDRAEEDDCERGTRRHDHGRDSECQTW